MTRTVSDPLRVHLDEPTKKMISIRAAEEGQSLSATAAELIRQGLENRSGNPPEIDTGFLLSEIRSGIGELLPRIREEIRAAGEVSRPSSPESGPEVAWTEEQARHLVQIATSVQEFAFQFNHSLRGVPGYTWEERCERANTAYKKALEEYFPEDRWEPEFVWTKEQAKHLVGCVTRIEAYFAAFNNLLNKDAPVKAAPVKAANTERTAGLKGAYAVKKLFPE